MLKGRTNQITGSRIKSLVAVNGDYHDTHSFHIDSVEHVVAPHDRYTGRKSSNTGHAFF